jgi:hypothetical protein
MVEREEEDRSGSEGMSEDKGLRVARHDERWPRRTTTKAVRHG